ncbi:hypothetical protein B0O80DRAFT_483920 [Mortierella sp. GBAus27b]|nr:hypothetical protein B0O80DRAFT_483920 [Mortierella sp. GBAus27b]
MVSSPTSLLKIVDYLMVAHALEKNSSRADRASSLNERRALGKPSSQSSPDLAIPSKTTVTKGGHNDSKEEPSQEIPKEHVDDIQNNMLLQLEELIQGLDKEQLKLIRREVLHAKPKPKSQRARSHPRRSFNQLLPVPATNTPVSLAPGLSTDDVIKLFHEGIAVLWQHMEQRQNLLYNQHQQERGLQLQQRTLAQHEFSQFQHLCFLQTHSFLEHCRLWKLQQKQDEYLIRLQRQQELEEFFRQQILHQLYPNGQQPQLLPPSLAEMYPTPHLQPSPPPRVITSRNKKHNKSQQRKRGKIIESQRKSGVKAHNPSQVTAYWFWPFAPPNPSTLHIPSIHRSPSALYGTSAQCSGTYRNKKTLARSTVTGTNDITTGMVAMWPQIPSTTPQIIPSAPFAFVRRRPVRPHTGPEIEMGLASDVAIRDWRYVPQHPDPVVAAMLALADLVSATKNASFSFGSIMLEYGLTHMTECVRHRRGYRDSQMDWIPTCLNGHRASDWGD